MGSLLCFRGFCTFLKCQILEPVQIQDPQQMPPSCNTAAEYLTSPDFLFKTMNAFPDLETFLLTGLVLFQVLWHLKLRKFRCRNRR